MMRVVFTRKPALLERGLAVEAHGFAQLSGRSCVMKKVNFITCCQAVRATGIAAALIAVGGCKSKEPIQPPDAVAESIGVETVRREWAEAAEKGTVPDGWMKTFNDPKMEAVVVEALKHNQALRAAKSRIDVAAAAAIQADALSKPAIGLGGGAGALGAGVGLNIQWELDVWGRLAAIQSAAEEQLVAVQNQYDFARESLAAQTAKAWYMATDAHLQHELAKDTVKIHEELVRVVKTKADAGKATPQDLSLAEADLSSAKERQGFAEGALKEAVRSLEVLLGRYPSAELEVAREFVGVPGPVPAGLPSQMLERRPDIIAADAQIRAAFQNVRVAQLAKLPRFGISGGAGVASGDLAGSTANANFFVPLYDAGTMNAQVTIETADQEQAIANYGQIALSAFKEVEEALSNEQLLRERETNLAAAVKQNEDALKVARTRYDAGKIEVLDVLQIQARTNASKASLIDMQNRRLANRIDLHLALGGSFEEPNAGTTTQPATRSASALPPT
jgi:outer membrane protein TolC